MPEIIDRIRGLQVPKSLSRKMLLGGGQDYYERLSLGKVEAELLEKVIKVLNHPELEQVVREDLVTLAMVKPQTSENTLGLSEVDSYYEILGSIRSPLEAILSVSIWFSPDDVEDFYGGNPKAIQVGRPSIRGKHKDRWDEFKDYMGKGPTTFILLFSPSGNAARLWREQIGDWDVDNHERDTNTIRGRLAASNYTSLVHGSDSTVAILREISFLRDRLEKL